MTKIETALQAGTVALLILFAILLVRDHGNRYTALIGVLFAFSVASHEICRMLTADTSIGWLEYAIVFGLASVTVFFWLLSRALFEDPFRPRMIHGLAVLGVTCLAWWAMNGSPLPWIDAPEFEQRLTILPYVVALGFVVLALVQAQLGRASDLIEARRRFRSIFVSVIGIYCLITGVVDIMLFGTDRPALYDLLTNGMTFLLVLGFLVALMKLGSTLGAAAPKPQLDAVDPIDNDVRQKLLTFMEHELGYRQEGLTITGLADQLELQAYRLRRIINRQLGYRNFNEFLNHYRVRDACDDLAEPNKAHLPVLTIALDLGYRSIGPFNRAFKDLVGMTPTDFRSAARDRAVPAFVVPELGKSFAISESAS